MPRDDVPPEVPPPPRAPPGSGSSRRARPPVPGTPIPRMVQRSGPSTLVVSLPKDWAERTGIVAGQFVTWVTEPTGELRLLPPAPGRPESTSRSFSIREEHFTSADLPTRLLHAAYALGYDRVQLEDAQGFEEDVRASVEQATHALLGFGLIEVDRHRIVATSFLDPTTYPVGEVISRIGLSLDVLLERLVTALRAGSWKTLRHVPEMRVEVRRLHALALRQLNLAATNGRLARQLGVQRSSQLLGNRVIVKLMDDMAEAVESATREISREAHPPSPFRPILEELATRGEIIRNYLRTALEALRTESPDLAMEVLSRKGEGVERFARTEALLLKTRGNPPYRHALTLSSWWIGVARQNAEAIAEVAFTRSLDGHLTGGPVGGGPGPDSPGSRAADPVP